MNEKLYARSRQSEVPGEKLSDAPTYELLSAHLRNASKYASDALKSVNLAHAASLVGLVHDMGKATHAFQNYLKNGGARGSVNHSFAAVCFLLGYCNSEKRTCDNPAFAKLTADILACATGSHHGLFDCVDVDGKSGFQHRLDERLNIAYDEAVSGFFQQCASEAEVEKLFECAVEEIQTCTQKFGPILLYSGTNAGSAENNSNANLENESRFFLSLLTRLLTSAVIEGDWRDSQEFEENKKLPEISQGENMFKCWQDLSAQVDVRIAKLPNTTPIDKARHAISQKCRQAACEPTGWQSIANSTGGIYRLNVPTGSGKTLSSLRFALAHAAKYKKARIVFTSPLLSILDQNAKEIRKYVNDDDIILEHHSNVGESVPHPKGATGKQTDEADEADSSDLTKFFVETWDAPIIITTLVQLLNTLFSGRKSCIRRFHSLCNSVIVIDEVQTVPNKMLSLFNLAVSFLAGVCNATVVLCSATQPCSEAANHPIAGPIKNMVPYEKQLWKPFERTYFEPYFKANKCKPNAPENKQLGMPLEEIPGFALSVLEGTCDTNAAANSLLIVCNKKKQASEIFDALPSTYQKFHLSAAMCMAHRQDVLNALRKALAKANSSENKVVCVSTQVIEAGVDISFERVVRLVAGMDSMLQAAGRCNRNGEGKQLSPVYLVQCINEELERLKEIKRGKTACIGLYSQYVSHPNSFENYLGSNASIKYFYKRLYEEMSSNYQDFAVKHEGIDTTLYSLLTKSDEFTQSEIDSNYEKFFPLYQAFKTAGILFCVYDNNTTDVLCPYGEGEKIISKMCSLSLPCDFAKMKGLIKQAKPYTVALYEGEMSNLSSNNALMPLCDGHIYALKEGYYDKNIGFCAQGCTSGFKEV